MSGIQLRRVEFNDEIGGLAIHVPMPDGTARCGQPIRPWNGYEMAFYPADGEPSCRRCLAYLDGDTALANGRAEVEKILVWANAEAAKERAEEATAEAQEWEARQVEPTIFDDTDDELSSRMWELMEATLGVIAYDVGEDIRNGLLSNPLLDLDKSKIQVEVTVQYGANKWVR